jgi:hypothetical protein
VPQIDSPINGNCANFLPQIPGWAGPVMAKKNPLSSVELTLSINSQTAWYLDRLLEIGLYGNSRAEAAKIAIYDHCKLLNAQGKLELAPPLPSGERAPASL